jgi:hypothetical protein
LVDGLCNFIRSQHPLITKSKDALTEMWKQLVKYDLVDPKDFKDKDSIDESTIDPQKQEKNKS